MIKPETLVEAQGVLKHDISSTLCDENLTD